MISFPQLFKQWINYIEKASKEHNGAFWNSKSVKLLHLKMIHCFEVPQLDRVSWIIWFRSRFQSVYRKSFDIDRNPERLRGMFLKVIRVIQQRQGWINRGGGIFCLMWAKIITIKRTKDLNYFSLCALNVFNTRVSQFELNYWNKWTFPRHSNLLRCTCLLKQWCFIIII